MNEDITEFGLPMRLLRRKAKVAGSPRQLSIFCHAAWFKNKGWMVRLPPLAMYYYSKHGVELETETSITYAISPDPGGLKIHEKVLPEKETYDYSLRNSERNKDVADYWEAATLSGADTPDLLLITGVKNNQAEGTSEELFRLSEVLKELKRKGYTDYALIRFYGCRSEKIEKGVKEGKMK